MATLIVEVNPEQEKVLETPLAYMDVSYQKIAVTNDFWDTLAPAEQQRIQNGLADAEAGRYSSLQTVMDHLNGLRGN